MTDDFLCDFVGWDWGTPAILQQKHPWKNWIKIWDWQTPRGPPRPPQLEQNPKFFHFAYLKAPLIAAKKMLDHCSPCPPSRTPLPDPSSRQNSHFYHLCYPPFRNQI